MISSVICEVVDEDHQAHTQHPMPCYKELSTCQHVNQQFSIADKPFDQASIPRYISALLKKAIWSLCPSFLSTRNATPASPGVQHNQIAVLDGLRGWACLFVFNEHLTYPLSRTFLNGYGFEGLESVIQFPFIRIPWSGFSMVCIFYVISGYVLSYKPLKLMQAKKSSAAQQAITSSLVRRPLRLYPPIFVAVFIITLLLQLGAFEPARRVWNTKDNIFEYNEPPPPYVKGFISQLIHAAWRCTIPLYVWDWSVFRSAGEYDRHTWTIVVEFRTSMILFLSLFATSRMTVRCRINMLFGFMMYCFYHQRREVLTFIAGALLAQIDLLQNEHQQTVPFSGMNSSRSRKNKRILFPLVCFILGLYLCSTPVLGAESTRGFKALLRLIPESYEEPSEYIRTLGALFLVHGAMNCRPIEMFFSNRLSSYLGKVSYALYLVHGPVIRSLLYAAIPEIYKWTGDGTRQGQTATGVVMAWVLSVILVGPLIFCLADLFWRFVDIPCVQYARSLEVYLTDSSSDDSSPVQEDKRKTKFWR